MCNHSRFAWSIVLGRGLAGPIVSDQWVDWAHCLGTGVELGTLIRVGGGTGPTVFLMGIAAEYAYIIRNIGLFEITIEFPKKEILMA